MAADKMFNVCVDVSDSNGRGYTVSLPTTPVQTYNGEPYKIIYSVETRENGYNTTYVTCKDEAKTYSFDSVRVYIDDADAADNYSYDNEFYIYGGNKQVTKFYILVHCQSLCGTSVAGCSDSRSQERKFLV